MDESYSRNQFEMAISYIKTIFLMHICARTLTYFTPTLSGNEFNIMQGFLDTQQVSKYRIKYLFNLNTVEFE